MPSLRLLLLLPLSGKLTATRWPGPLAVLVGRLHLTGPHAPREKHVSPPLCTGKRPTPRAPPTPSRGLHHRHLTSAQCQPAMHVCPHAHRSAGRATSRRSMPHAWLPCMCVEHQMPRHPLLPPTMSPPPMLQAHAMLAWPWASQRMPRAPPTPPPPHQQPDPRPSVPWLVTLICQNKRLQLRPRAGICPSRGLPRSMRGPPPKHRHRRGCAASARRRSHPARCGRGVRAATACTRRAGRGAAPLWTMSAQHFTR